MASAALRESPQGIAFFGDAEGPWDRNERDIDLWVARGRIPMARAGVRRRARCRGLARHRARRATALDLVLRRRRGGALRRLRGVLSPRRASDRRRDELLARSPRALAGIRRLAGR